MRVLITSNSFGKYDDTQRTILEQNGWEIVENRYNRIMSEEEMIQEVVGVDAIILGSDPVTSTVIDAADKLKIISRYGVGIDNIDVAYAKERGIEVTVTKNCNSDAVADYTLGLMLSTLRHISTVDKDLKEGVWKKQTGLDLCDKTVGVFGLGSIGKGVVKRLSGFGCKILGYDVYIDEAFVEDNNVTVCSPEQIFKEADIITLHIPGNSDGTYFISTKEIESMKSNVTIVNTARASLVDEDAIIHALKTRRIYGYGTDVFSSEPNIPANFIGIEHAVLSPHTAAVSVEAVNKMTRKAVENILEYFNTKE